MVTDRIRYRAVWAVLFAAAVLFGLSPAPAAAQEPLRVLFIGNSLTTVNDLPALVRRIAEADGARMHTKTVALDGVSLEDHWNHGTAGREIARGRWDFVVLQQGPSSLPDSRTVLREYVGRFDGAIRKAGARPALYMVWPARARQADFERVSESYRLAAADIDAVLLPVGEAWRAAWKQAPSARLYGADNFHPSRDGSWLAALVIYCRLSGKPPEAIKAWPRGFPKEAALFVNAVTEAFRVPPSSTLAPS